MAADTYFIVEEQAGKVGLFVEALGPGGEVEFFSETDTVEYVSNVNQQPFQDGLISVPGRSTVRAPLKRNLGQGKWFFRLANDNRFKLVDIVSEGARKVCMSLYTGLARVRQNLVKQNGADVTVGVLKNQTKLDVTVYFTESGGTQIDELPLPSGVLYGEVSFKVKPQTRHIVLSLEPLNVEQSGGTDQGDLVIYPPSGMVDPQS